MFYIYWNLKLMFNKGALLFYKQIKRMNDKRS